MNLFVVIAPILLLLVLVLVWRRPLWVGAGLAFCGAVLLGWLAKDLSSALLLNTLLRALILSCEVGLILLGAITFLEYMEQIGAIQRIKAALGRFTSGEPRLDALLLAWLFCGFLEGVAGFGAPAALVAPLLVSLGFSPLIAAVLPLIGDSAAVPFGAVGTPIRVGFAGIEAPFAAQFGAGINIVAGLVAPVAILLVARRTELGERSSSVTAGLLLALWSGLCFTLSAFIFSFAGPEFPSIFGSLAGILIFGVTLLALNKVPVKSYVEAVTSLAIAFAPYLLVCILLLGGKLLIGQSSVDFKVGGSYQSLRLFQPGMIFLVAIVLISLWRPRGSVSSLWGLTVTAGRRLPYVWVAIFCLSGLAQLTTTWMTGVDIAALREPILLVLSAPLAGAAGAFVAGSATLSNLIMAPILAPAAELAGVSLSLVLGIQVVGAGCGNMVSLQNIAAVQATVGLVAQERQMLAVLWKPCLVYIATATIVGLVVYFLMSS